jgi:hypothetical protein
MNAATTRWRPLRWVATVGGLAVVVAVGVMFFPQKRAPLARCAGHTGPAAFHVPYAISLRADGDRVLSTVDFDRRLWRAVDDRVARDGLVASTAMVLDGAVTLVNGQEATFGSPAAYATLLPLTRADGCASAIVARSGHALPRS